MFEKFKTIKIKGGCFDNEAELELFKKDYNKQRPCFAIGYDTPVGYRKRYYKGELDRKDTFSKRELSELPKFVQKRKNHADNQKVE